MSLSSGDNPVAGTGTASSSAAALGSQVCQAVLVQNDPASTVNLLVGGSANQTVALQAGQSVTLPCSNISQVFVKTASGNATFNWISVN